MFMSSQINNFPEFEALQNFILKNNITTKHIEQPSFKINKLVPLEFKLNQYRFIVYVDDEYADLSYNNELLNCILVLRALESL